jgi:hypothetical protein
MLRIPISLLALRSAATTADLIVSKHLNFASLHANVGCRINCQESGIVIGYCSCLVDLGCVLQLSLLLLKSFYFVRDVSERYAFVVEIFVWIAVYFIVF